jgi:hypothetical protein
LRNLVASTIDKRAHVTHVARDSAPSTLPDEICALLTTRPALRQVAVRARRDVRRRGARGDGHHVFCRSARPRHGSAAAHVHASDLGPEVMDVSVTTAADVSSLDSAPAIGLREWASGARPVVGAIAASSSMLFACSWFAFSSGVLGPRHDVGRPDPVRIGGTTPQLVGGSSSTPAAQPSAPGRVDVGARHPARARAGTPVSTHEVRQSSESGPVPEAPAANASRPASTPAPSPSVSPTSSVPAPSEAPASPTPPPVGPNDLTSNLPAPLAELPSVPLPTITPPVTVPDLPVSGPAVSTVTTILGVP